MSYLHLIQTKNIEDIPASPSKGKLLPVLEANTLEWAKEKKPDAYKATLALKEQSPNESKYFKYLRRLLELKLEEFKEEKNLIIDPIIKENLKIESLRSLDFLSCSQISMWKNCKRKFFLRYSLGIKKPKNSSLAFGSAIDNAINFLTSERINGQDPPLTAIYAAFYESFDKEKEGVVWETEETSSRLLKQGPAIIRAYMDNFANKINPVSVQHEININLDRGGRITGAIDILEKDAILDNKTAKALWETEGRYAKHKQECQPLAYSLWFFEEYKKMPKEFRYQIMTKEDKPQTQLIAFEVKKYEVEKFRREAQEIWDEIQESLKIGKDAFTPEVIKNEKERSRLCTQQWCDYAEDCLKDGLKIAQKWDKENKCFIYD